MILDLERARSLIKDAPICYVDAGARGDLEGAWGTISPLLLKVLAFEPDPDAEVNWAMANPHWHIERCALWSDARTVTVHIGEVPATSSVWPPNFKYLTRFSDAHVAPRRTTRTVDVSARPLDDVVAELKMQPDFLKIDTQGAEFDILQGSADTLDRCIFGVVVETWTTQIHAGQGCRCS